MHQQRGTVSGLDKMAGKTDGESIGSVIIYWFYTECWRHEAGGSKFLLWPPRATGDLQFAGVMLSDCKNLVLKRALPQSCLLQFLLPHTPLALGAMNNIVLFIVIPVEFINESRSKTSFVQTRSDLWPG